MKTRGLGTPTVLVLRRKKVPKGTKPQDPHDGWKEMLWGPFYKRAQKRIRVLVVSKADEQYHMDLR